MTSWGIIIGGSFVLLTTYGTDQIVIQRYLSTKSYREYRNAVIFNSVILIPLILSIYAMGVGIYAFYQRHPEMLSGLKAADAILPYFIVHQLPNGISGLIVAPSSRPRWPPSVQV